jgi:hypothetical protein
LTTGCPGTTGTPFTKTEGCEEDEAAFADGPDAGALGGVLATAAWLAVAAWLVVTCVAGCPPDAAVPAAPDAAAVLDCIAGFTACVAFDTALEAL